MISATGLVSRWAYIWAVALCLSPLYYSLAAANPVLDHQLHVRLDPVKHQVQVVDRLKITKNSGNFLVLSLAGHVKINTVTLNGRTIKYQFRRGRLAIPLSTEQANYQMVLKYEGVFNDAVSAQPLNTDNPGYGVTGTIQPEGTLLLSGSGWYPQGQATSDIYRLTVDAPQGTLAVTSGKLLGHTNTKGRTQSRWQINQPLEGLSLVAGPFHYRIRKFGRLTAATYFSDELQVLSPDYLNATGRYLKFYEDRFGPYPYDQFAVVENFFPTGYGFPSYTLMGRRVLQLPFIIHTSLGHEIAHCWWGNGVLVNPAQGNWSEGLTTYVADYLYKEQKGKGAIQRNQWLRNYASLVDDQSDFALSNFSSRSDKVTKTVGYDKAAMVFHMLRQQAGEDIFWQTLRDVYSRYRFQSITWSHWQSAFEQSTGRSFKRFFQQWVYRAGAPQLTLSGVEVIQERKGYTVKGSIEQSGPSFNFEITVALRTNSKTHERNLSVSGARTPFSFHVTHPPQKLIADPHVNLFRRLAPFELPATINSVKGAASVTVVVARNMDARWIAIAQRLATALGLDSATIRREEQLSKTELANSNLVWIGQPRDSGWPPQNQTHFTLDEQTLTLDGQSFSRRETSFFGVFKDPRNSNRVMALFLPESLTQATVLCTKIPHYGKYSYLVFEGARNRVKDIWPVADSPLTVHWSNNKYNPGERGAP